MENEFIYIGIKLFNYSDKLQAESLEEALRNKGFNTFLPFRDSDEHNILGDNKTKIIYDCDIERLSSPNIKMMVALYEGLCKDEGISFELGFCYGKNIKIFLINTDFIWFSSGEEEFNFDPILEYSIDGYYKAYNIPDESSFKNSLLSGQAMAFEESAKRIEELYNLSISSHELISDNSIDICIDFGGNKYYHERAMSKYLKDNLEKLGYKVHINNRFEYKTDLKNRGKKDLEFLINSRYYIINGDTPEVDSGSAFLLGVATAMNKTRLMFDSSCVEVHGENEHKMKKNLMIDFSINYSFSELDSIIEYFKNKEIPLC